MSILDTIGNTPLIKVERCGKSDIYAKLEYFNPGGSVKDRAALYMIKDALDKISADTVLIEPTSGNTGIGLALVAREFGLRLIIVMPENMSVERRKIIKALGGEIVLTEADKGMKGAIEKANELKSKYVGSVILSQFDNQSNPRAHYETTAREIVRALPNVKWIVSPVGTGGTIMGIKKYFLDNNVRAKVVAVEPASSPVLSGGEAGKHIIAGIGAGFVPSIVDTGKIDKIIKITDEEAVSYSRALASKGVFGGFSSGAAYCAAQKLAKEAQGDIVFIVPDTGMRYLSTELYNYEN
ncbi:MAG: PLP-dependent cysteine synthase family protein [Christensenellales bacterium]|jgi:cysteine synthase A